MDQNEIVVIYCGPCRRQLKCHKPCRTVLKMMDENYSLTEKEKTKIKTKMDRRI